MWLYIFSVIPRGNENSLEITSSLKGTWLMLVTISKGAWPRNGLHQFELHEMPSVMTPNIPYKSAFPTLIRYFHYGP
jgi:hypothetical protein